jgi:hypothetical protein
MGIAESVTRETTEVNVTTAALLRSSKPSNAMLINHEQDGASNLRAIAHLPGSG